MMAAIYHSRHQSYNNLRKWKKKVSLGGESYGRSVEVGGAGYGTAGCVPGPEYENLSA
jgi:hypothetical protein